jgi:hypothetical protein
MSSGWLSRSERAAQPRRFPLWRPMAAVWGYLAQQYPPLQAISVGLTAAASYAVFGLVADGHLRLDTHAIKPAVLVTLLFLQYRLIDDTTTAYDSDLGGRDVVPADPRLLIVALVTSLPLEFLLEPHRPALLVALTALALMLVGSLGMLIGRRVSTLLAARVIFVEIVPVLIFGYVYFAWSDATGRNLPATSVIVVIGGLITGFQFWKWSRHLGVDPVERIYSVGWPTVRAMLALLTLTAAGFSVLLYREAKLSAAYLVYTLLVCTVFAALAAPRGQTDDTQPWWTGVTFPVLLQIGLYLQLLVLL